MVSTWKWVGGRKVHVRREIDFDYSTMGEGDLKALASIEATSTAGRKMKEAAQAELKSRAEFKRSFRGRSLQRV